VTQYLLTRGYGVLLPNVRGSYGLAGAIPERRHERETRC